MSSAPFIFVPVVAVVPVVPVGTTYWRQFLRLIAILTIFAHWKCKVVLLHMPKPARAVATPMSTVTTV